MSELTDQARQLVKDWKEAPSIGGDYLSITMRLPTMILKFATEIDRLMAECDKRDRPGTPQT